VGSLSRSPATRCVCQRLTRTIPAGLFGKGPFPHTVLLMADNSAESSNKYDWQSWPPDSLDGMPPKRRRLVGWGLLWFLILGSVVGGTLGALGLSEPWRSLVSAIVLVAVFVPLIRSAVQEDRSLRREGIELPSIPVSRKSLITNSALAIVLWIVYAFWIWMSKVPVFPLLPVACTAWVAFEFSLWRRRTEVDE
jgi:MFS family permease